MRYPEQAWKHLGDLLTERRVQLNPQYRNRLKFAADTGMNERLIADLEHGRRTSYRPTSLQAVEVAYQLVSGSLTRTLDSGSLETQAVTTDRSHVTGRAADPPLAGVRVTHHDNGYQVTYDPNLTMDDVRQALGDLTDVEQLLIYNLEISGFKPGEIQGAVQIHRARVAARRMSDTA